MTAEPHLTAPAMLTGGELLARGRDLARHWRVGTCTFLKQENVLSEAAYKRRAVAEGRMMQHAHIGFRSVERTVSAMAELYEGALSHGVRIDRFGVTLDWTMGYPSARRTEAHRGTGIILKGTEDFARITGAAPAAAHFGDFMLGLPAAVENTCSALAAGATSIGNIGQYFTFRLPYWDDDVATTEATVTALGLIAAQEPDVLVHSNLDDGFAGLFRDVASAAGMMLIEKHIIEDLVGARASFCFGHHFTGPLTRMAFQTVVARATDTPGTMIFGNTVAYRGEPAANYASLASYLSADLAALRRHHSGHAINPVPVTEHLRIPDTDEILEAQLFAHRLAEHGGGLSAIIDFDAVDAAADRLAAAARRFADRALTGLSERDVDVTDPAALMLAIRRLGARRMEMLFGAETQEPDPGNAVHLADWAVELEDRATAWAEQHRGAFSTGTDVTIALGTTDVHEHGAYLVRHALEASGAKVVDAGVAVDPETLVRVALQEGAHAIAVSTYNGVGLSYARAVMAELYRNERDLPVMIGGKLNEVPEASNSQLPVDVSGKIAETGAIPCRDLDDMLPVLQRLCGRSPGKSCLVED